MNAIKELIEQIKTLVLKFAIRSGVLMIAPLISLIGTTMIKVLTVDEQNKLIKELRQLITARLQKRK